jgi:hypothetical protein
MEDPPGLVFRLYSPDSENLKKYQRPIQTEPVEAMEMVESIIEQAKAEAPDLEGTKLTLAPKKMDGDLKRMMKPQVDELIDAARESLLAMRRSQPKSKVGD